MRFKKRLKRKFGAILPLLLGVNGFRSSCAHTFPDRHNKFSVERHTSERKAMDGSVHKSITGGKTGVLEGNLKERIHSDKRLNTVKEKAIQLIKTGFAAGDGYNYEQLISILDQVIANNGFYELYSIDNKPSGSGEFRGSTGVLYDAILLLEEYAESASN